MHYVVLYNPFILDDSDKHSAQSFIFDDSDSLSFEILLTKLP